MREHNARQMTTLRSLAATRAGLSNLTYPDSGGYAAPAEFVIAGMRIRAGRVRRLTLSALAQALASMPTVALQTAGRYGPYWVLTFESAAAPLVVLVDKLAILPDRHGGPAPLPAPAPVPMSVAGPVPGYNGDSCTDTNRTPGSSLKMSLVPLP